MSKEISHTGIVIATNGDNVRVLIEQTSACASCEAHKMCMASESRQKEIDAIALEPMVTGDKVEITGTQRMQTTAVLLAYVLPFVILVTMVFILNHFTGNEAITGTIAIASLLPYLLLLRVFSKRLSRRLLFTARKKT